MFIIVRVQWLMQLAHLTLLRLDLLEVAIDDTLEKKLILALLFRVPLVLHPSLLRFSPVYQDMNIRVLEAYPPRSIRDEIIQPNY